jgi:hypothetical protein
MDGFVLMGVVRRRALPADACGELLKVADVPEDVLDRDGAPLGD